MQRKTFLIFIGITSMLVASGIIAISLRPEGGLLDQYDPDNEGYWPMVPDDVLIYALFDETNYKSNNFKDTSYALMKHTVLAVDDQGVDIDSYPDLLLATDFLIGNEKLGITLGQMLDMNLISLILQAVSGSGSQIVVPTLAPFHIVNSEYLTLLEKLTNPLYYDNEFPLYSFDYLDVAQFADPNWQIQVGIPNQINVTKMPNERNWSQGIEFKLQDNSTDCQIGFSGFTATSTGGKISFWVKPAPEGGDLYFRIFDELGVPVDETNGIMLKINKTSIAYFEGSEIWFENPPFSTWVVNERAGNWTVITSAVLNGWNQIQIEFPADYVQNANISINKGNVNPFNFTISQSSYPYHLTNLTFAVNGTTPSTSYLDDFNPIFTNSAEGIAAYFQEFIKSEEALYLFRIASIYSMFYYPKPFNMDAFYQLISNVLGFITGIIDGITNSTWHISDKVMLLNNPRDLRIRITKDLFDSIIHIIGNTVFPQLLGVNISYIEGNVDWNFEICWDKQITALNASIFTIDYLDLNITRQIGMKLITTRSEREIQDGYWYYTSTWYNGTYLRVYRPYARHISELNRDNYPSRIPKEWDVFSPDKIVGAFLEEFDFTPLISQLLSENGGLIVLGIGAISGTSIGGGYGIYALREWIDKRRLRSRPLASK